MQKTVFISAVAALLILIIAGFVVFRSKQSKVNIQPEKSPDNLETQVPVQEPTATSMNVNEIALTITSPDNGSTVKNPKILLKGKTIPRAEVFVNNVETVADAKGNFSVQVSLDEGENIISVAANDADGRAAEQELTVTYSVD